MGIPDRFRHPCGVLVIVATGPRVPLALHPGLRSFAPCGARNPERFRHPCGVLVIVALIRVQEPTAQGPRFGLGIPAPCLQGDEPRVPLALHLWATVGFGRDPDRFRHPCGVLVIVATGPRVPLALHPGLRSFAPCGAGNPDRLRHPCGVWVMVATGLRARRKSIAAAAPGTSPGQ